MKQTRKLFRNSALFENGTLKPMPARIGKFSLLILLFSLLALLRDDGIVPYISTAKIIAFMVLSIVYFELPRLLLPLANRIYNRRYGKLDLVDGLLLFVCAPDDAEAAAGDLIEELEKVNIRHGRLYCNIWFVWELMLLVAVKGLKRLTKSVFGPLVDLWKRKSG